MNKVTFPALLRKEGKPVPHFLFTIIQLEFLPDALDWMEKTGMPMIMVIPMSMRVGAIPGAALTGANPNMVVPMAHIYSKAPEEQFESRRQAFQVWHAATIAERQKAAGGIVKVSEGEARAGGLNLN